MCSCIVAQASPTELGLAPSLKNGLGRCRLPTFFDFDRARWMLDRRPGLCRKPPCRKGPRPAGLWPGLGGSKGSGLGPRTPRTFACFDRDRGHVAGASRRLAPAAPGQAFSYNVVFLGRILPALGEDIALSGGPEGNGDGRDRTGVLSALQSH